MIAKMQEVILVGRRAKANRVVAALQTAGVLHLEPIDAAQLSKSAPGLQSGNVPSEDSENRRDLERTLARAESALAELGATHMKPAQAPEASEWKTWVETVAGSSNRISARRGQLENELAMVATFRDLVHRLADMSQGLEYSQRVALLAFTVDKPEMLDSLKSALKETLSDRFVLETRTSGSLTTGLVAVQASERDMARATLSKVRIGELRLPGRFDGGKFADVAKEFGYLNSTGPQELSELEQQMARLRNEHGAQLLSVRNNLRDQIAIYEAQAQGARGKFGFALKGYLPESAVAQFKQMVSSFADDVLYELHDADEHHSERVPVQLVNNGYVRNFEFLLGISQPPRYGSFDPSWIVSAFFPLFFGFVIADIGLGLLFMAVGLWMRAQAGQGKSIQIGFMGLNLDPKILKQVGFVISVMSAWAILWGFLTGEFFGTLFEHLHIFYIDPNMYPQVLHAAGEHATAHSGLIPIVFPRVTSWFAPTVMMVSIGFGILFLFWSWGLKAQLSLKHKHMSHFWEAIGMLGGMAGLVLLSYTFLGNGSDFGALASMENPINWVMYLGFAVFLVGMVQSKVWLMVIEILSQGGNIISFSRLFAVGLASAILANLATDLGWGLYESMGVLGAVLGIVVSLLIHAIAIALTLIGHVMQPLRLHYVEFLNPTGFYTETGPRYNPFRSHK